MPHVLQSSNLDSKQSAYMPGRSAETSLVRLTHDLHHINDQGSPALMISLDLSAAFDCIDHNILLKRLEDDFGVSGPFLSWIQSFITQRSQCVVVKSSSSASTTCDYGVPQGSVFGPVLFALYTSPLAILLNSMEQ